MKELKIDRNSKIIVNDDGLLTIIGEKAHKLYFKTMNELRFDNEGLSQMELSALTNKKIKELIDKEIGE